MTNHDTRTLLTGIAIGATTTFFLDPTQGARRRALIRGKAASAGRSISDGFEALSRNMTNRARGVRDDTQGIVAIEMVPARKLVARVRAELGRVVSHPRPIGITATDDGCVELSGPILTAEVYDALAAGAGVRGVRAVIDNLERHDTPDIPSLQDGRTRGRLARVARGPRALRSR